MSKLIYIVAAAGNDRSDEHYIIDSVWTSRRKARKRCDKLNEKGLEHLLDEYGCGLFDIEQKIIQH